MMKLTGDDIAALGTRAECMIQELAAISAEPNRLVRLFLTPEHRRAADLVAGWMRAAGLEVSEDALGTVRGRRKAAGEGTDGRNAARRLLIGSHIDSVIDAGKYDGPLGVIAGILAVEQLARRGVALPFGVDVLAFGDEEGSRFPSTLSTSAAAAGAFTPETLGFADRDGVTFAAALKAYGKDPGEIAAATYPADEAAGYVEVHIEQGPVLEAGRQPLGIVSGIVGQSRLKVTVTGEAGHAGTVPMGLRKDALAGAAEMVLAVERIAREHAGAGMVATVGRIDARPGAGNVIPGEVTFSVDLRCMDDSLRRRAVRALQGDAWTIVETRGLEVEIEPFHEAVATPMAPALQAGLEKAAIALGHRPVRIPSGAGHDAQMMAKLCPSAMLFVRCRGGISHNPAEHASSDDMGAAIAALIGFIVAFDPDTAAA